MGRPKNPTKLLPTEGSLDLNRPVKHLIDPTGAIFKVGKDPKDFAIIMIAHSKDRERYTQNIKTTMILKLFSDKITLVDRGAFLGTKLVRQYFTAVNHSSNMTKKNPVPIGRLIREGLFVTQSDYVCLFDDRLKVYGGRLRNLISDDKIMYATYPDGRPAPLCMAWKRGANDPDFNLDAPDPMIEFYERLMKSGGRGKAAKNTRVIVDNVGY